MRIHVASFDSADGAAHNEENCNQARKPFKGNSPKSRFGTW